LNKRPPRYGEKIVEKKNTLLLDSNALFKFGFYGAKDEYNHFGKPIGGVYQFLTVLRKLMNETLYHKVFAFWDGEFSGKLRYLIYEPYKSGRGKDYINGSQPKEQSEVEQQAIIRNYLEDLFIRQLQDNVVESDDFIAYYCGLKQDEENITICTNDRDMCQLISPNVRIYFCDLKKYIDTENYFDNFGYHYKNAALIKTIIGDTSDTIVGVKGVKLQTLLNLFPTLKTEVLSLDDIIILAKEQETIRLANKKKPLKALTNIINGINDGVQGNKLYEINNLLVNLLNPMITESAKEALHELIDGELSETDRGLKNVLQRFKVDGLERMIGQNRYPEYLLPFKKYIDRELKETTDYE
jgi:5'-3' exonuclease